MNQHTPKTTTDGARRMRSNAHRDEIDRADGGILSATGGRMSLLHQLTFPVVQIPHIERIGLGILLQRDTQILRSLRMLDDLPSRSLRPSTTMPQLPFVRGAQHDGGVS